MRQFFFGNDGGNWEDLEQRLRRADVLFRDQEMPAGSTPLKADVKFYMVPEAGGGFGLSLGNTVVNQSVSDCQVRNFLTSGKAEFKNFKALQDFIVNKLSAAYETAGTDISDAIDTQVMDFRIENFTVKKQQVPDEEDIFLGLKKRVLGQDEALRSAAKMTKIHLSKTDPSQPLVMMAVGNTGCGKTKSANALGEVLGKIANFAFLPLSMELYNNEAKSNALTGSSPGYAGYNEGSVLIDKLRSNPRSVILFDEIDKAHESIFTTLLSVMDSGRMVSTDRAVNGSRMIDARRAIFFFTSNLASNAICEELERSNAYGDPIAVDEVCRRHMTAAGIPGFIVARIQRFIVFEPLKYDTRIHIAILSVKSVAIEFGLQVANVPSVALAKVMEKVTSTEYGARSEKHAIIDTFGRAFSDAASRGIKGPVEIIESNGSFNCVKKAAAQVKKPPSSRLR